MGPEMKSGLLLNRYVVQESLGSGSGGVVNLAWDTRMERNVAIKRIPLPEQSASASTPGLEEARTAAKLRDSRIVTVHDFELSELEALIIMEYIDGMSLGKLMDRTPRKLTLGEIASVAQNVGKALQHAHRQHVLHLDVKPDNILVDTSGQSKMTDFGISKLSSETGAGPAVGGTIGYMPPEQLLGEDVTPKSDQWAFAVLVYELIVGENPFIAPTFAQSLDAIEYGEVLLPSSVADDVDEGLDDVLFRALSINPEDRYSSVSKFVSELMPYLDEPKEGLESMGELVLELSDPIALGSPQDRMASLREMAFGSTMRLRQRSDWEDEEDEDGDLGSSADEGFGRGMRRRELPNLKDAVTPRIAGLIARGTGAACCGIVSYMGMGGILSNAANIPEAAGIAVAIAAAALGALTPRFASAPALLLLGIGIIAAGFIPNGVVMLAISAIWWIFVGRESDSASNCGVLAPCLGPALMAYLQPLMCGYCLDFKRAALTSVFGVATMLVLFPITGCGELFSSALQFSPHTTANDLAPELVYKQPGVWVEAAGWIASTMVLWLLANRGSKALSMVGAAAATAIMIVSRAVGAWTGGSFNGVFSPEAVAALVLPFLMVAFAIWVHDPDRCGS